MLTSIRSVLLATALCCGVFADLLSADERERDSRSTAPDVAVDSNLRARARAQLGVLTTDAPQNEAQVALGRALFFDTRIGADDKTGCVTCHLPEHWGADGLALSPDARGKLTERNSQTVFNAAGQPALRWRGDRRSAAHQAEDSLKGSIGYARVEEAIPKLKLLGYEPRFKRAFPSDAVPLSPGNFGRALEAYQRTLMTPAPFDAYLHGDESVLTMRQKAGLRAFLDFGCGGCHSGPLLGGTMNQKFGIVREYWSATQSKDVDSGRYAVTHDEADKYVFRVSSLRNVAKTAPYFHDGSVVDLRKAVQVMAAVQLGRELSIEDADAIVAFLDSLTGAVPASFTSP